MILYKFSPNYKHTIKIQVFIKIQVNKSKVVVGETSGTHTTIDLKAFADKYKTVDISLSHKT